ncbi:hypothetical protein BVC80_8873g19 [Macleaya cordata]|uniref:Uncharacterized protein n=1 Tax=Macleaya cordata TaxID=56857 RepID=A0A200Q3A7_MACCD|nr:hypothetical protein BVC80_8873g19 [Macleaya cordata]
METPSSTTRRVTRSQTKAAINSIPMSRKNEESEKVLSRQKNAKPDRSALIDITNDSPIVGLAMGSLETPSSYVKRWEQSKKTPGSGEALLRYQAKTLLQKVEEEAELSKLTLENRPFLQLQGFVNSPSGLLAPTPANTPQVLNLSANEDLNINVDGFVSETLLEVVEESKNQQMVIHDSTEVTLESQKSLITRLIFDFSDKSEISDSSSSPCSSVLTYQERSSCNEKSTEEDDASVWSIQVNASLLDELCEGLSKITVQEKKLPEFEGKHTRFIYNSDDEIEGEEDISVSPSVLRLKGLPTPEGKHLRFPDEEEE